MDFILEALQSPKKETSGFFMFSLFKLSTKGYYSEYNISFMSQLLKSE